MGIGASKSTLDLIRERFQAARSLGPTAAQTTSRVEADGGNLPPRPETDWVPGDVSCDQEAVADSVEVVRLPGEADPRDATAGYRLRNPSLSQQAQPFLKQMEEDATDSLSITEAAERHKGPWKISRPKESAEELIKQALREREPVRPEKKKLSA